MYPILLVRISFQTSSTPLQSLPTLVRGTSTRQLVAKQRRKSSYYRSQITFSSFLSNINPLYFDKGCNIVVSHNQILIQNVHCNNQQSIDVMLSLVWHLRDRHLREYASYIVTRGPFHLTSYPRGLRNLNWTSYRMLLVSSPRSNYYASVVLSYSTSYQVQTVMAPLVHSHSN